MGSVFWLIVRIGVVVTFDYYTFACAPIGSSALLGTDEMSLLDWIRWVS